MIVCRPQWRCAHIFLHIQPNVHIHVSIRDEFCSGGLKSLARIFFSIACTKTKWFCPNITWFFCPKMAIWKILGGLQPPSAPWAVSLWMYMCWWLLPYYHIQTDRHVNIQNPASSKRWIQFQVDFGLCLLNSRFLHKSPNASYHLKNAGFGWEDNITLGLLEITLKIIWLRILLRKML